MSARAEPLRPTPATMAFAAILAKDLRSELRTLRSLPAMALFAVTTFVIFRFGARPHEPLRQPRRGGALGDAAVRRRSSAINRLFVAEREEGGFDAIRLAPIDRTVLLAAKAAALRRLPGRARADHGPGLRALLPRLGRRARARSAWSWLLADLGLAATGALISSMAVNSRARDLLVPLLLLPLVVPLMIAATGASEPLLEAGGPAVSTVSAPGWRCSVYTIWCSSWSDTRSSTSCWRTDPARPARPA